MSASDASRLRAEMASARGRVARNLDAIEAELWQRAEDAMQPTPDARRHRLGALDLITKAVLYARERGWLRLLWDRGRQHWRRR